MNYFETRRRMLLGLNLFPREPSEYIYYETIDESCTWTAPKDGWYQIELQGASGNGGKTHTYEGEKIILDGNLEETVEIVTFYTTGGGGGGGGCAISRVKLKFGDTVILSLGTVGSTTTGVINSSMEEYDDMSVTAGKNGGESYSSTAPSGGSGGEGSDGNYANYSGGNGEDGNSGLEEDEVISSSGGSAGYGSGNNGGNGQSYLDVLEGIEGSAGFAIIYAGDTN